MKIAKRSLTGVLLLDKPLGISSNGALGRAKFLYHAEKAGHTGTLDPLASGLLPVCFGEATKFAGFMLNADKTYETTVRLGRTTTTGDLEGAVLTDLPVNVTELAVREVLQRFTGRISQTPPMYSAIKLQGQPLYKLARQSIEVPRESRTIEIRELTLLDYRSPFLKLRVVCSKGTYIRVLAEDIGQALGCGGGMLEELRRTGTGEFVVRDAVTLDALQESLLESRDVLLKSPDQLVSYLPRINLLRAHADAVMQGRIIPSDLDMEAGVHRAYNEDGEFLGLVDVESGNIKARRMMSKPF
jgi:tRNA pseudouridine55 synthase